MLIRRLRRFYQCNQRLALFALIIVICTLCVLMTDVSDVENIVWTSMGAVINCTAYEKEAARPMQVQMYFHKGPDSSTVNTNSITLVTQLSINRLSALFQVIQQWDGYVSAAVYVTKLQLPILVHNISSHPNNVLDKTSIHVVIDDGGLYPINYLRNVALNNSVTDYVFLSDVDFIPVPGLHTYLQQNIEKGLLGQKDVLVVPAFIFDDASPVVEYPANKPRLLEMIDDNVISLCGITYSKRPSQCPTDYNTWYTASQPYVVTYHRGYEPYIVMKRADTPSYNQGFVGRELDKVSHLLEVHAKGCPRRHFVNFENELKLKYEYS